MVRQTGIKIAGFERPVKRIVCSGMRKYRDLKPSAKKVVVTAVRDRHDWIYSMDGKS